MNDPINNLNESSETVTNLAQDFEEKLLNTVPEQNTQNLDYEETHLQTLSASLRHVQSKVELELPSHFSIIHIGKSNDQLPPDIDLSGFPHSQIVSRIHADIIRDNDDFYIEDTGSANGTYINHTPLPRGNRHRLKSGDRIAFGKEDKVSFIFQLKM